MISLATLAEARGKNKFRYKNKTYHTYTKYNPEIDKVYAGRTSGGSGTLKDIARRDKRHHKNQEGYLAAEPDKSSKNYKAIRGREQHLIKKFRDEGRSGNLRNGISPNNPNGDDYLNESIQEFGLP